VMKWCCGGGEMLNTTRSSLVSEENSFLANIIRYRETIPRKQSMLVFPTVHVFLCTLPRKFSRKNLCQWSTFFYVSYRGKITRKRFVTAVIIKCLLTLSHFSVPATHTSYTRKRNF
jgi:peroxiredoxin